MRAPRWKLMIRIGLERLFDLPIIRAPKRNSKLHCEMWTNSFLPRAFWARSRVRRASRGFDERHARFEHGCQTERDLGATFDFLLFRPPEAAT